MSTLDYHSEAVKKGVERLKILGRHGELLMQKSMLIVGSSTSIGGRASGFSKSAMVSSK